MRSSLFRWTARLAGAAGIAWLGLVVGGGLQAVLRHPDLHPWHTFRPSGEARASDLPPGTTLQDYLDREARVFDEVAQAVEAPLAGRPGGVNRYTPGSLSHPARADRNWNRTFEMVPADVRGGALLVHGLTDSPYSMRSIAEALRDEGHYVLAPRMPGHGTVPASLATTTWEDWLAAVRLAARHVRARAGEGRPFVLVGYSNGGALAVKYTLEALSDTSLPAPTHLVLVSPMIAVTPFAGLSRAISRLSVVPGLEKAAWIDVVAEYNPYKYNSFPANAALQTYRLTRQVQADITAAQQAGRAAALPPMLTFQSIVDATVSTPAVVERLYDRLGRAGDELVGFDVNRVAGLDEFFRPSDVLALERYRPGEPRAYRRTLVTNRHRDTLEVVQRSLPPGATAPEEREVGLRWPRDLFSLSHIALPFPPDDPVYGYEATPNPDGPLQMGRWSPRGERAVLTVTADTLMRAGANPFHAYLVGRVREFVRRP